MTIERTNNEIVFRLPADFDTIALQKIVNYIKFKEAVKTSQATEDQVNQLAAESKRSWWHENKSRFIQ